MEINFRSLKAFEHLSESNIKRIEKESKIKKYSFGFPICMGDILPSEISIILKGEARLLNNTFLDGSAPPETIAKIGPGTFVGLSSILRAESCESITASTEVIAASLPDSLILDLYKQEISFRNWCNTTVQVSEIASLAFELIRKSSISNLTLKNAVPLLYKNALIQICENENYLDNKNNDLINLIASNNIIDKKIGEIITGADIIKTRGPLPARIYSFPKSIYNQFNQNKTSIQLGNSKDFDSKQANIEDAKTKPVTTSIDFGQYNRNTKLKLIKGQGALRECLACLQMVAIKFNVPYRGDSIEQILLANLKKDQKPSAQLFGHITSMMGLYTFTTRIPVADANRLPTPCVISWGESFAIVEDSNAKYMEIISPKDGRKKITFDQLVEYLVFDLF